MSFLLSFFKKRPSAPVAYNRLQILLSHERASIENSADHLGLSATLLEQLQREILEVVKRHIAIEQDKIHIKHKHEAGNRNIPQFLCDQSKTRCAAGYQACRKQKQFHHQRIEHIAPHNSHRRFDHRRGNLRKFHYFYLQQQKTRLPGSFP